MVFVALVDIGQKTCCTNIDCSYGKFGNMEYILVTGSHLVFSSVNNPSLCIVIILIMVKAAVKREPITWQQSIVTSHDDGEWVLHVGLPNLLSKQ